MEADIGLDGMVNGEAYGPCLSSYVDEGPIESHRYFRARKTALEMLKDRGYAVPPSEIEQTLAEFRDLYSPKPDAETLRVTTSLPSDPSIKVMLHFCDPGVVKVPTVRHILTEVVGNERLSGLILVVQNVVTSQALRALDLFPFKVEVFQITDLLVNIRKHVLKPKHHTLTDREKQQLLSTYSLEEKQIPRISPKDAVVRYFGLQKGQVVKVTHNGEITQSHVTYRCVG